MRTPLALTALALSLALQPGCAREQAAKATPAPDVVCSLEVEVMTPRDESGPGDDEALAYLHSVLPVIAAYDGSADWHAQFAPLIHEADWSYDAEAVDHTIAFTRDHEIRSVRIQRFTTDDGSTAWACDIIYKFSDREYPVLLDLTIHHVGGAYHIRSMSRDMC